MPNSTAVSTALLVALVLVEAPALVGQTPSGRGGDPVQEVTGHGTGSLHRALEVVGGAATGLAIHESGHVAFDLAFHAHPHLQPIDYAGIPFFEIDHDEVSRRRRYVIAAAGLWVQGLSAEWLLTRDPDLRRHDAPFRKGVFAFHMVVSAIYAGAGFASTGPRGRDTRGMAVSLGEDGVPDPYVGALVLAPAALDAYRYFHPESRWAVWASRATKLASMALTLAAG